MPGANPHAGKTVRAASAKQMQQERFRLIVPMMSEGNTAERPIRPHAFQKGVTHVPRGKLQRDSRFLCDARHVGAFDGQRYGKPFAERLYKCGVCVRFLFAHAVMQMRRFHAGNQTSLLKRKELQQQCNGVRSARQRDKHAVGCGYAARSPSRIGPQQHDTQLRE